jgi:hypothetical protein
VEIDSIMAGGQLRQKFANPHLYKPRVGVHIYNPSYIGGIGRRIEV